MKKLYLFVGLMFIVSMLVSAFAPGELSTLTVRNKVVNESVVLSMTGIKYGVVYSLTADAPTHAFGMDRPTSSAWIKNSTFDIKKDIYDLTIYQCGISRDGTINMVTNNRLVFPSCFGLNPNAGEPGNEKVDVYNSVPGTCNVMPAGTPGDGKEPWGCGETPAGFSTNGDQIHWRLDWFNWWNGQGDSLEVFWP